MLRSPCPVCRPVLLSLLACALLSLPALAAPLAAQAGPTGRAGWTGTIEVDASEAPRRVFHARLTLPAAPGPLVLYYPKWIPGEHGPTGPITDLVGLRFAAGGKTLPWRRDPVDMYAFHLDVPAGAEAVEAQLDYLAPVAGGSFTAGSSTTPHLAVLSWHTVLLYPQGVPGEQLTYEPRLRLPAGWQQATALAVASEGGGAVAYRPVSMTELIDAPVLMGAHLVTVPLADSLGAPHRLDIAADSPSSLVLPEGFAAGYDRLVAELHALFGARHYRGYRWLVALSDYVAHFGQEHHESSDNRMPEATLAREALRLDLAGLLAHEYVHSWNAKYRRPVGLVSPDYHEPMQGELLWVYEGLTQYLGYVLPPRSGLWSPEYFRERLAALAAALDHQKGRSWRPLADTAVAAQILLGSPIAWSRWRRGADFYDESVLLWLEADALIREQSGGRRSLDDFLRRFHGGENGGPQVVPYTYDDLVAALEDVADLDWRAHFDRRLQATGPEAAGAPLAGLEAQGWRLVYDERPNPALAHREERYAFRDWISSLGMTVEGERIADTVPDMPAAKAGLAPGMTVVAVDGRRYSGERLDAALDRAKGDGQPIELLVENADAFRTVRVEYRGGRRYPHLERIAERPDLLAQTIAARAKGRR